MKNIKDVSEIKDIIENVYSDKLRVKETIEGAHDCNWSREYNEFYSNHSEAKPYVKRVIFQNNSGKVNGFLHLRPLSDGSPISETYIEDPFNKKSKKEFIKCSQQYDFYGYNICCVPYIQPDKTFGMCIQAALWICFKILHPHGIIRKDFEIPLIQKLATGNFFSDGQGLFFNQVSRIIRMHGCSCHYINSSEYKYDIEEMIGILYAYVESGYPVILGVNVKYLPWWNTGEDGYHAIVVIGHTMDDQKNVNGFIVHDESKLPYQVIKLEDLKSAWVFNT